MINYDETVAQILSAEFQDVDIYHDKAPEVGDASYPYLVYKTLSISPNFYADDRNLAYQHTVRVTVVGKNGNTKDIDNRVLEAMEAAGYIWQNTSPTVEDVQYGETYTAIDFVNGYWR